MKHISIHQLATTLVRGALKTKLALAVVAWLATANAHAEVFVYRGISHSRGDISNGAGIPPAVNTYVIVDYDQRKVGFVSFFKQAGAKKYVVSNPTAMDVAPAQLPKGQSATFLVGTATTQNGPGSFGHVILYFRGTDTTLTTRVSPSPVKANRPRALTGLAIACYANAGAGTFNEQRVGTTFDSALTIKTNNANQTLQQALDALSDSLKAKGYVSL